MYTYVYMYVYACISLLLIPAWVGHRSLFFLSAPFLALDIAVVNYIYIYIYI